MKDKNKVLIISSAGFLMFLLIFRDSFAPGTILFGHDAVNIYLPFRVFAREMLFKYFDLPLWLPNIFMGVPLISSSSLLYFYPTNLLFMILPFPLESTYTADMIIHMLAAGAGMYLFLRQLKLRKEAALFGGLSMMLSGFLISYINAGHWNNIKAGALIPFVFYFLHRALNEKSLFHFLNTAVILGLQMMATGMQIMAYTYMGAFMYCLYYIIYVNRDKKQRAKLAGTFIFSTVFILLFSALQFIPSTGYTNESWRGDFSYSHFISWSMHPVESITFIFPQFFGLFGRQYWGFMPFNLTTYYFGILPFLLLFFLDFKGQNRKLAVFLSVASLFFLILSFGGYGLLYRIFYYIPVLKQFRNPGRFLYLFTFFILVLSSVSISGLLDSGQKDKKFFMKRFKYLAITLSAVTIAGSFFVFNPSLPSVIKGFADSIRQASRQPLFFERAASMIRMDMFFFVLVGGGAAASILLFIRKKITPAVFTVILLAFIFIDCYRIDSKFIKYEKFSSFVNSGQPVVKFLKSKPGIFRVAGITETLGPNRGIYYGLEAIDGLHGLIPARNMILNKNGLLNRLDMNRVFNVRYYLTPSEINIQGFSKIYDGNIKVYQDSFAMERIFFVEKEMKFNDRQEIMDYMKAKYFDGKTALVTEESGITPRGGPENYRVRISEYSPNRIKFIISTDRPGMAVISNLYYKRWKAKVNGKKEKTTEIDGALTGIPVKSGDNEIIFYYDRTWIIISFILTVLALAAYVYIWIRGKRKKIDG